MKRFEKCFFLSSEQIFHFSSLSQALAAGFESSITEDSELSKLQEWCQQICRLLHLAAKISPDLISLLQMCLVNLVSHILAHPGADEDPKKFVSLIASMYPLPTCDAKTLCLAKIQVMNENV